MALKTNIDTMNKLLEQITKDLVKACRGNKAASQRVRTGTIKLEKVAKMYRKESVQEEKSGTGKKRIAAAKKKASGTAKPKAAAKRKAAPKAKAKAKVKVAAKKKPAAKKTAARSAARRRR